MSSKQNNNHAPAEMQEELETLANSFELLTDKTLDSIFKWTKVCYPDRQAPRADFLYMDLAMNMIKYLKNEKKKVFRENQNCGVSGAATAMSTDNYDDNVRISSHTIDGLCSHLKVIRNRVVKYRQENPFYSPLNDVAVPVLKELKSLLWLADALLHAYAIRRMRFTAAIYETCIKVLDMYHKALQFVIDNNPNLSNEHKKIPPTLFDCLPKEQICFG